MNLNGYFEVILRDLLVAKESRKSKFSIHGRSFKGSQQFTFYVSMIVK